MSLSHYLRSALPLTQPRMSKPVSLWYSGVWEDQWRTADALRWGVVMGFGLAILWSCWCQELPQNRGWFVAFSSRKHRAFLRTVIAELSGRCGEMIFEDQCFRGYLTSSPFAVVVPLADSNIHFPVEKEAPPGGASLL